jgi:hypothetical protein
MSPGNPQNGNSSLVRILQRGNPGERSKAVDHIITAHWKPLYKYLRLQYQIPPSEAWTVILNFLELLQEKAFFDRYDPARMTLREFIRQKLDVFVPTPGARKVIDPSAALDFSGAEEEFHADQHGPGQSSEQYYNNEWVRILLTLAVEELNNRLAADGKSPDFSLFFKHDLQEGSGNERVGLEEIAAELSMPLADAMDSLAKTRQRFQTILMDLIRSFTSSDEEFRREARAFFRA